MIRESAAQPVLKLDPPPRILVVEARFYEEIGAELYDGAMAALKEAGAVVETIRVPGALEIPAVIRLAMAARPGFEGYVALGCVIRGETTHFEHVCTQSNRGLMDLATSHGLAIGNGILTVENEEQALRRARRSDLDKGGGAAIAALSLIAVRRRFGASAGAQQ